MTEDWLARLPGVHGDTGIFISVALMLQPVAIHYPLAGTHCHSDVHELLEVQLACIVDVSVFEASRVC